MFSQAQMSCIEVVLEFGDKLDNLRVWRCICSAADMPILA